VIPTAVRSTQKENMNKLQGTANQSMQQCTYLCCLPIFSFLQSQVTVNK